ncbi:MAG: hypothetical protein A3A22_00620 [Candidatus Taylorbacteria bacterium RIFCSPLOWO2_01_FULL_45_34b]|nr:MAG: hypothetical protein A3A22_00620 [Candidatus Taylorbacteria bacterium RIFCSPLOWO2_01_FULL_45_34b]
MVLISHLLLGEKTLRPAEGGNPNSFGKSDETAWACLRHAHSLVGSQPLSSLLVSVIIHFARTFFERKLNG